MFEDSCTYDVARNLNLCDMFDRRSDQRAVHPSFRADVCKVDAWSFDDDDVYYYIRWRLKLEGETENMGVCTKERKGVTAAVLMATPCTNSL